MKTLRAELYLPSDSRCNNIITKLQSIDMVREKHDIFTCAQFPDGVFTELHFGSLSSNQNGCLRINGAESLTPATWRFVQWSWKSSIKIVSLNTTQR